MSRCPVEKRTGADESAERVEGRKVVCGDAEEIHTRDRERRDR
jgi:hypothetical protein